MLTVEQEEGEEAATAAAVSTPSLCSVLSGPEQLK